MKLSSAGYVVQVLQRFVAMYLVVVVKGHGEQGEQCADVIVSAFPSSERILARLSGRSPTLRELSFFLSCIRKLKDIGIDVAKQRSFNSF
jgi:hypothetical protein